MPGRSSTRRCLGSGASHGCPGEKSSPTRRFNVDWFDAFGGGNGGGSGGGGGHFFLVVVAVPLDTPSAAAGQLWSLLDTSISGRMATKTFLDRNPQSLRKSFCQLQGRGLNTLAVQQSVTVHSQFEEAHKSQSSQYSIYQQQRQSSTNLTGAVSSARCVGPFLFPHMMRARLTV